MKIRSAKFLCSAPDLASCPEPRGPEFAFIGRSNVGKSSLINLLTRVKGLALVSSTPGKTKLINFFRINEQWNLVDLPGYGYAKVGRKDRAKFSAIVAEYLKDRPNLVGTFVLIDSRLSPQEIDLEFLSWMVACGLPLALIFTKADKLSDAKARVNQDAFLERFRGIAEEVPPIFVSSSKVGKGRDEILGFIASAMTEDSGRSLQT
jgi:GTP-binding protein